MKSAGSCNPADAYAFIVIRHRGSYEQIVATRYLSEYGDLFGLKRDLLKKMSFSHAIENGRVLHDSDIYTNGKLPVWQSGILVQMRLKSFDTKRNFDPCNSDFRLLFLQRTQ